MIGDLFPVIVTALFIVLGGVFLWQERARQDREHGEAEALRQDNIRLWIGSSRLVAQIEAMDSVPVWRPEDTGSDMFGKRPDTLVYTLQTLFSKEELEVLSADAGLDFESIGGQGLPLMALRLADLARRKGKESDLIYAIRRVRPNAKL